MTRKRTFFSRSVALATLLNFLAVSCGSKAPNNPNLLGNSGGTPASQVALVQLDDAPEGLDLRLSEGQRGAEPIDRASLPPARKLAASETAALLARAKALPADASDKQPFALRSKSQPPPRTGKIVSGSFPPPPSSLLPPVTNEAGKDLAVASCRRATSRWRRSCPSPSRSRWWR